MFDPSQTLQWQKYKCLFSVMSAPKPKRGRESEEGLSVSEEVTFDATNDPSVTELEDLRVEDEKEVGTSETALNAVPGGCSSQSCANEEQSFQPKDKPSLQLLSAKKIEILSPVGMSSLHG